MFLQILGEVFNNQQNSFVEFYSRNLCSRILLIIIASFVLTISLTLLRLNFRCFVSFTPSQEGDECRLWRERPDIISHLGSRLGYLQAIQNWEKTRNHKCLSKVNLLLQILYLYKCKKPSPRPQCAMLGF